MRFVSLIMAVQFAACASPGDGRPNLHFVMDDAGADVTAADGFASDAQPPSDTVPLDAEADLSETPESLDDDDATDETSGTDTADAHTDDDAPPSDTASDAGIDSDGCTPDCADAVCGDDGCGGSCGTCGKGTICELGVCAPLPPPSAIFVNLTWSTPGDLNGGDNDGTDLDLHLAHQAAAVADVDGDGIPEPWFDTHYDCHWAVSNPDWGVADDNADDPKMNNIDDNGAGPESIQLPLPEYGVSYRIGVHYYADKGYGPSIAKVDVYLDYQLVVTFEGVTLVDGDLWEVALIAPSSGTVTSLDNPDGTPEIIPNYPAPSPF